MIFFEMYQVRRDLIFESKNRFNIILDKSYSRKVVDAYIGRVDIKSVGFLVSRLSASQGRRQSSARSGRSLKAIVCYLVRRHSKQHQMEEMQCQDM